MSLSFAVISLDRAFDRRYPPLPPAALAAAAAAGPLPYARHEPGPSVYRGASPESIFPKDMRRAPE